MVKDPSLLSILGIPTSVVTGASVGKEIEQKFLFSTSMDSQDAVILNTQQIALAQVRKICSIHEFPLISDMFEGTDHCVRAILGNKSLSLRYRRGHPMDMSLGVKIRSLSGDNLVKPEQDIQINDPEPEKILSFLRIIASLGSDVSEMKIGVQGIINKLRLEEGWLEIPISTSQNEETGSIVSVAEIEAVGFQDEEAAKAGILQMEELLGWKRFRTDKSMVELLSPAI